MDVHLKADMAEVKRQQHDQQVHREKDKGYREMGTYKPEHLVMNMPVVGKEGGSFL